jgi:hypothetical protein
MPGETYHDFNIVKKYSVLLLFIIVFFLAAGIVAAQEKEVLGYVVGRKLLPGESDTRSTRAVLTLYTDGDEVGLKSSSFKIQLNKAQGIEFLGLLQQSLILVAESQEPGVRGKKTATGRVDTEKRGIGVVADTRKGFWEAETILHLYARDKEVFMIALKHQQLQKIMSFLMVAVS